MKTGNRTLLRMIAVGSAILALPFVAAAQTDTTPDPAATVSKNKKTGGDEKAPKVKVERGRGGRKVFRITTSWVIEGRIQKPNAFYVLQRSQINYDWAKMKKNFLPRITESVDAAPF